MTRTAGHDRAILPPHPQPVQIAQSAIQSRSGVQTRTIELCWTISTLASQSLLQDHARTRTDENSPRALSTVVLSIKPAKAGQKLTAVLEAAWPDGSRQLLLEEHPTDCRWSVDQQHQLEHIDIAGVVHCTLGHVEQKSTGKVSGSTVGRALFVRTPWLARVGLKPGTYVLSGMRVLS